MASAGKFIISTLFNARDKISPAYKNMTNRASKFGTQSYRAFRKASTSALNLKQVMGGILGAAAVQRGIGALTAGVRTLTDEFISFDHAIISASAKMGGIKQGTEDFLRLQNAAREMGATTEFTATEAAGALNKFAMAGFKLDDAIGALPGSVNLATLSEKDLEFATDFATAALAAFGLKATHIHDPIKRSAEISKNMARVNDVLAKTLTTSTTDMEELAGAMTYAGSATKLAGGDIADFAALAGSMAESNIRGEKAGRAIAIAYTRLSAPPRDAAKMIRKLKLETADSNKNLRPIVDILADLEKKTAKLGNTQKMAAYKAIFGQIAMKGFGAVMSKGVDALRDYREVVDQSSKASDNMSEIIRSSLKNRLATLKSSIIEVGFKFFDAFSKKFPGGIDAAVEAVRNFNIQPIIGYTKDFIDILRDFYSISKDLAGAVKDVIDWLGGWDVIKNWAKWLGILYAGYKGYIALQWAFNTAMAVNPLFLGAIGVAGFLSALETIVDNWTFLKNSGDEFRDILKDIGAWMLKWTSFIAPITIITVLIKKLTEEFRVVDLFFDNIPRRLNEMITWVLKALESFNKLTGVLNFLGLGQKIKSINENRAQEKAIQEKTAKESLKSEGGMKYQGKLLIEAPQESRFEEKYEGLMPPPISVEMLGQNF